MPSSKNICKVILPTILLLTGCAGFIQELTLYHGLDCTGASVTFQTKEQNLANWDLFLSDAQSFQALGWWWFFTGTGFAPYLTNSGYRSTPYCANSSYIYASQSLRFAGPLETATPALAVYESWYSSGAGREVIFTTGAANNFGFIARSAIASGTSSWTLYYNENFTGNTTCLSSGGELVITSATFGSAIMGCN